MPEFVIPPAADSSTGMPQREEEKVRLLEPPASAHILQEGTTRPGQGAIRTMDAQQTRSVFLVRHGRSEWNGQKSISGQMDPPLSVTGVQQSLHWERLLREVSLGSKPQIVTYQLDSGHKYEGFKM